MFLERATHFVESLGERVKGRAPKKLESLTEVPIVVHVKVHVRSFDMNLISSPYRIPRPSCPLRGKFGRTGTGSSNEEALIVYRASLCNVPESTRSKLQYDPYLISVACS